jgi:hypothetical protein
MPGSARILFAIVCSAGVVSAEVDFRQQIQPIFESACIRCHGADKAKGDLRLDTKAGFLKGGKHGPLVNAKDYEKSEMLRRIKLPRDHEDIMPQETEPLSGPHKNWLTDWVRTGAKWPDGVVLKVRKKEVPGLADKQFIPNKAPASLTEAATLADKILAQENAISKGAKAPVAGLIDDLAFLRRATVDLIGRIPAEEEIKQFERESAGNRREKLVDRLIAHPRFAERWTVFFADMLRVRSQTDGGPQLLAFVNRSIAEAKPYDQMARELIATNGRPENTPAAGFALGDAANPMALAGATSQIFMGVRLQCAECHDHPFDDWKQKEFYDLAAYFGTIKRVETGKNIKRIYTTEAKETAVKWPPEREQAPKRDGVPPKFPFELVNYTTKPHYISRLEERRKPNPTAQTSAAAKKALDDLVDGFDVKKALRDSKTEADILAEAKAAARQADDGRSIYQQSEARKQLAAMITDPRNPYFARAFVNRVWSELVGRGFVEPLDDFSAYNEIRHPQTLQFLAQEFVASGYDLRTLVKTVMLTQAYQRGHLPAGTGLKELALAEESFTATRARRMLGEVLFDSVAVAGHLLSHKWPEGANVREVKRQIRIPFASAAMLAAANPEPTNGQPAMMAMMKPAQAPAPYDLEKGASLDFEALLKPEKMKKDDDKFADVLSESKADLAMNKKMEDDAIEAERQARIRLLQSGNAERFRLETVTAIVDDNPKFDTTLRMATPAPASHFLRVFGQPARDNLGEFRDESPSLRQELMLLNGKATHEASRVGPLEPVHHLITGPTANPVKAVEFVYLEIFTRRPTAEELADARAVIAAGKTPAEGLADLRWAMLNSHEFRYLP